MERARRLHEEALHIFQELGDNRRSADALGDLADISLAQGDCERAGALYRDHFRLRIKLRDKRLLAASFEGLSRLAAAQGQTSRAVRLCSAANALRAVIGTPLPPAEHLTQQHLLESLHETLGEAVFALEWESWADNGAGGDSGLCFTRGAFRTFHDDACLRTSVLPAGCLSLF